MSNEHYEAMWKETLTTSEAANLLGLLPHTFRMRAEDRGYRSLGDRWELSDSKQVAFHQLATGRPSEQEAARSALKAIKSGTY